MKNHNKLLLGASSWVLATLIAPLPLQAQPAAPLAGDPSPPALLQYQSRLLNSDDTPVNSPGLDLRFRIYDAPTLGSVLFEETLSLPVSNGLVSALLGGSVVLDPQIFEGTGETYLGVKVGTDAEMVPRLRLASVAYAFRAASAKSADDVLDKDINPASVTVNGTPVIDSSGNWVGSPTGLVGPTGPQGLAGADGADGAPGPAGPTGPQGLAGADGADGAQGLAGPTGPQGLAGADGADGAQGLAGPTGPQGLAGADGADGAQGPSGPTGPQGPAGPTGPLGSVGPAGPTGPAGSADAWSRLGNAGTTAGTNFLGTTDNVALEVRVNDVHAMRFEPVATADRAPNIVGGYSGNSVTAGVVGATISGGGLLVGSSLQNEVTSDFCTVGGGANNVAGGVSVSLNHSATIGGGGSNRASARSSTVAGGTSNNASGFGATISGGSLNTASATKATIGGGDSNQATGEGATVPGGEDNRAIGSRSFAAGHHARANETGSFVWSDTSSASLTNSSGNNSVTFRAAGGYQLYSDSAMTTGVSLAANASAWTALSDRNSKENIETVDGREVLRLLAGIPISTWNYKAQDDSIRHMGPMAQDFFAAFGLGEDELRISTLDPDGVALAAIQGLHLNAMEQAETIEDLRSENRAQTETIEDLRLENGAQADVIDDLCERLEALEALVSLGQ